MGLAVAFMLFTCFGVHADTYESATFSGGVQYPSVSSPFDGMFSAAPGNVVTGQFVYDNQQIPTTTGNYTNVMFNTFPDYANIAPATLFSISIGSTPITFSLADAESGGIAAIQYDPNNNFRGFVFQGDFTYNGIMYQFNDQGGTWGIYQFVNGYPGFSPVASGYINSSLSNVQDFTPTAPVPEPASLFLLGSGLVGTLSALRRRVRP